MDLMSSGEPSVTQEYGAVVVLVSDDASDGLVDGPRRLLPVPLGPRQTLGRMPQNTPTTPED